MPRLPLLAALTAGILLGCGGATPPSFSVAPESRTVVVGDHLPMSASANVELAGDLEWEVEEPYGGGLRNSVGGHTVYFAPEAAGTYHVVLRATRADGHKLKQAVEIRVLPLFALDPPGAQVAPGGTVVFSTASRGLGRNAVKWSVDEPGGGEIDQDGRYQAPARPGTYHVTAVSGADPQVSARATIVVGG